MKRGDAPATADRVYITRRPNGTVCWTGGVGLGGAPAFGNSMSDLRSIADAEAEAIEWARSNGAREIIIVIESDDS
jgi:hypothetical protein